MDFFEWGVYGDDEVAIQVNDCQDMSGMYPMTLENQGLTFSQMMDTIRAEFAMVKVMNIEVGYYSSLGWNDALKDDDEWRGFCEAIAEGTKKQIRSLTIQVSKDASIPDHRMKQLLQRLLSLEEITFEGSNPDDNYGETFSLLALLPRLTHIRIEDDRNAPDGLVAAKSHLTAVQCRALAGSIINMKKQLKEFTTLNTTFESESDARLIVDALSTTTSLEHAHLGHSSLFRPASYCQALNTQLEYITALNRAGRGRIDPNSLHDLVESIVQVRNRVDCIYYFLLENPDNYCFAAMSSSSSPLSS